MNTCFVYFAFLCWINVSFLLNLTKRNWALHLKSLSFVAVLPQWQRFCHRLRWCYMPAVWPACRPGADGLLTRQHHLWHHLRGVLQERPPTAGWLWRFQLQRVGHFEGWPCWYVKIYTKKSLIMHLPLSKYTYNDNFYVNWHLFLLRSITYWPMEI